MSILFRNEYGKGKATVADFIRHCARAGIRAVEISRSDEMTAAGDVERALLESGIAVSSYNLAPVLLHEDTLERRRAWQEFDRGIERATMLRSRCAMLFPGPLGKKSPEEERRSLVEALRECVRHVPAGGPTLVMENVGMAERAPIHGRTRHMRQIVEDVASPRFRLAFDTGNFMYVEEDPVAALSELLPCVVHVHLKDVVRRGGRCVEVPIGTGSVDFPALFKILADACYDGYLSVECAGDQERSEKEEMLAISLRNVERLLDRIP